MSEWVSAKKRMPKEGVDVLVWTNQTLEHAFRPGTIIYIAWHEDGDWNIPVSEIVTHWMPLPKPPKEYKHAKYGNRK